MKKIIPIALLMFVLTVASVWSIAWFSQARTIKSQVEQAFSTMDPALGSASAQSVKVSGFPLNMVVTLHQPTINLQLSRLLSQSHKRLMAFAGNSAGVLTTPTYPEGSYESRLDGTIQFTINALSNHIEVRTQGTLAGILRLKSQSNADVISEHRFSTSYHSPATCHITVEPDYGILFEQLWSVENFFSHDEMLNHIRTADCQLPATKTTNVTTGTVISQQDASFWQLTQQAPINGQSMIDVVVSIKNYEITPEGDQLFNTLGRALTPQGMVYSDQSFSMYGKNSLTLDMQTKRDIGEEANDANPLYVHIRHFSYANNVHKIDGKSWINVTMKDEVEQGEFDIEWHTSFLPQQTEVARASVKEFVAQAVRDSQHNDSALATLYLNTPPAAIESILLDALPTVTQMGTITARLKGNYTWNRKTMNGTLTLPAFELSLPPYGIYGEISGAMNPTTAFFPDMDANLICRECISMVDTLGAYIARLEQANPYFTGTPVTSPWWPPEQTRQTKELLAGIGIPLANQPDDLQFVLKKNKGNISINQKTLEELTAIYQQTIEPAPSPATDEAPAASDDAP